MECAHSLMKIFMIAIHQDILVRRQSLGREGRERPLLELQYMLYHILVGEDHIYRQ